MRRIAICLQQAMPEAPVELDHTGAWELLVATILSAQCTDERVNRVTPALFQRYQTPTEFAQADQMELESLIHSTGFFRSKARNLIACAQYLIDVFHGIVPDTMEALITLPGIGRKTANVLLGACFGRPAIVVDTHVKRVAHRLQFSASSDPTKIEQDLQGVMPQADWTRVSQRLLLHGRYVCTARKPRCGDCAIFTECLWEGKAVQ